MTTGEILQFETTDRLLLPGILFPVARSRRVLIYLHGCGTSSVFYKSEEMKLASRLLARKGIAFFPFNNRGAHLIHRLTRRGRESSKIMAGTGFEVIRDCVHDIDGALRLLRARGFKEFYIAGHSTGANKIVVYDSLKKGRTPFERYILHGGGDDSGIYRNILGRRFEKLVKIARLKVQRGQGAEYVPINWLNFPYSYRSFLDICEPGGRYDVFPFNASSRRRSSTHFKRFAKLKKPTLVQYGALDEVNGLPIDRCIELLKATVSKRKNFEFNTILGGDHGCTGYETELYSSWARFLRR